MIALNRLKSQPLTGKRTNTVVPDISLSAPPKRMAASKSSLTERIRNKLSVSSSVVHRKKEKLSCPSTPKPVYRSISTSSISPNRAQVTAAASRRTTPSSTAQRNHQEITPAPKSILKRSASTTCCNLSDEEQAGHRAIKIRSSMMDDLQPLYQIQQQYRRLSPSMQRRLFGKKLKVRFAKDVGVKETFGQQEYDRGSDPHAVCNRLTPFLAQQIKEELNAYKLREMLVHDYSRIHTHFFL
ncbi:uncharacterized protein BYT42DRAFT_579336 [Radiomyces spectabilis]|uniref:uncharacterized protein n=1 Tax=Radiomyces spectabilis TaxID=64574 RepID=UPI00221EE66D|nr:uncharacterized protein BYT42DRAFT_579336 [Radiomyces spectabilis]KAI8373142.1 hypothetical protein BYT42DRAFT_579336 [Radiomyces spectabilis]